MSLKIGLVLVKRNVKYIHFFTYLALVSVAPGLLLVTGISGFGVFGVFDLLFSQLTWIRGVNFGLFRKYSPQGSQ